MESTTPSNRTLEIDGMHGEACVQKVTGALKGVRGVTTQSVQVGSANITADDTACSAACGAVGASGYKVRERDSNAQGGSDHSKGGQSGQAGQSNQAGQSGQGSSANQGSPTNQGYPSNQGNQSNQGTQGNQGGQTNPGNRTGQVEPKSGNQGSGVNAGGGAHGQSSAGTVGNNPAKPAGV